MKCSPGDLGTKDALRVLSDRILSLIGSSVVEPGLFKVAVSLGRSSGRLIPGMLSGQSQGVPTAFSGSAASTITANGLSGSSFPDFLTRIKCWPGSKGTKEIPGLGNEVGKWLVKDEEGRNKWG